MSWPSLSDYNEALQNPQLCFVDTELKHGQPSLDMLGFPKAVNGAFASVYQMICNGRTYAVRCFQFNQPDNERRYAIIGRHLNLHSLPCMVNFEFLQKGINVKGKWYPILKMEWVNGEPLEQFVSKNLYQPVLLKKLAEDLITLMQILQKHSIAHGDLQHGNILVSSKNQLRLIDYDGMFVPGLSGLQSEESGHRNYQHPIRQSCDFSIGLDSFSAWTIYISLLATRAEPKIWHQLKGGDDCLLFHREDFIQPQRSQAISLLRVSPDRTVRDMAEFLVKIIEKKSLSEIPCLDESNLLKVVSNNALSTSQPISASKTAVMAEPMPVGDSSWIFDHLPPPETATIEGSLRFERLSFFLLFVVAAVGGGLSLFGYLSVVYCSISIVGYMGALVAALHWGYRRLPLRKQRSLAYGEIKKMEKELPRLQANLIEHNKSILKLENQHKINDQSFKDKCNELDKNESKEISALQTKLDEKLNQINNQRRNLGQEEKRILNEALINSQRTYVFTKLSVHKLDSSASVSGIGPSLKSRLYDCGIYTAADIINVRIENTYQGGYSNEVAYIQKSNGNEIRVDGIGPTKAQSLIEWRNRLANTYWTKSPKSLSSNEESRIKNLYADKTRRLTEESSDAKKHHSQRQYDIRNTYKNKRDKATQDFGIEKVSLSNKQQSLRSELNDATHEKNLLESKIAGAQRKLTVYKNVTFMNYLKNILLG